MVFERLWNGYLEIRWSALISALLWLSALALVAYDKKFGMVGRVGLFVAAVAVTWTIAAMLKMHLYHTRLLLERLARDEDYPPRPPLRSLT